MIERWGCCFEETGGDFVGDGRIDDKHWSTMDPSNSTERVLELLNKTETVLQPVLTKLENFTNELTFFIFDNQLVNRTIGANKLSQLITITLSILAIGIGSYASIEKPSTALDPSRDHPLFDQTDNDSTPTPPDAEITTGMVVALPILAGVSLLSMYYFVKNHDKVKLSEYLNRYIVLMSLSSVSFVLSYLFNSFCREWSYCRGYPSTEINRRYTLTLSKDEGMHSSGFENEWLTLPDSTEREKIMREEKLLEIREDIPKHSQMVNYYFTTGNLFGFLFGFLFCILFYYYNGQKNWILNNILGVSTVIMGISSTKIPNFKVATLFLTLFFFYDIYFVFGTDVMLSVATQVDIPAKLMIPNSVSRSDNSIKTSILGLGDLALPGAFISLCLRFDLFNFHKQNKNVEFHHLQRFAKPYFIVSLVGYLVGLIVTFKVVEIYKVGQPALLYLCPAVVFSVYALALYRGDLKQLWSYNESAEEEKIDDKDLKIDVICSKETLFLAGEIADEDIDDAEDLDYDAGLEIEDDDGEEEEEEEEKEEEGVDDREGDNSVGDDVNNVN